MPSDQTDDLLAMLESVMVGSVAADIPDLTVRGLSVLLVLETQHEPQTVRSIADRLGISSTRISQTMRRLERLNLAYRMPDPTRPGGVLLITKPAGTAYVARLSGLARGGGG